VTLGLVDTHCHLYMEAFAGEEEAILRRAREKGVQRLLVPGIDLESSERAVALAQSHPEVYAAVGVHPHSAIELDDSTVRSLEDLARQPKVLAIGEIGLDFYRDRAPRPVQEAAFQQQLELACRLGLPVVVHCREAMETLLPTLIAWSRDLPQILHGRCGVLHAFSGTTQQAARAIEAGFYIGAAGPITYPSATDLRLTLAAIDPRGLLTETDAPYLAPQAHRGERNEPAHVDYIAVALAEIAGAAPEALAERVMANARALFKWDHGNDRPSLN
jgi:TatD DNase family protein